MALKNEGTVTISIRLDAGLKEKMEALCDDLGMSMSTAYTIFTKKCVNEHGIPFKVSSDPIYSAESIARIKQALQDLDDGKGVKYNPFEED